jgi:hypothetical protein
MKFTVVFSSHESCDLSYGLVFIPCPVWMQGEREILNLNPENPYYQPGSVRRLWEAERVKTKLLADGMHACTVVIHPVGNGSWQDLHALVADLKAEGFSVAVAGEVA